MRRAALLVPLVLLAMELDAHALGPVDVEAAAKVGGATELNSGFGLGGRAGVQFFHVYAGASGVHYFGRTPPGSSTSNSTDLYGLEVGYTITALPIVELRPQVGVGFAHIASHQAQPALFGGVGGSGFAFSYPTSANRLYVEPGLLVLVPVGILLFGADFNELTIPTANSTFVSFSAHAQIGVRF